MKVFISWSGDTGRAFAKILHSWLPSVLQAVKPFFSPDDIAKGARWSNDVGTELEASQVGIIVVTRESLSAPWVMFEAGALSKNVGRAKVAPILVDVGPNEVDGPLMQFQCATFDAVEIKRLLRMLNSELKDFSITDDVLEAAFSMWWPTLEQQVAQLVQHASKRGPAKVRSERELLEEILELSRSIEQRQSQAPPSPPLEVSVLDLSGALTLTAVRKRLSSGGNLAGANLMNLELAKMDLSRANLRGANLVGTDLSGAHLVGADLTGANLERAILDEADLRDATLSQSNLWRASMRDVRNLSAVRSMNEANFFDVDLNDGDRKVLAAHNTLSISNYPDLFAYYRKKGIRKSDLRDLFLWTAHWYPGEGP